MKFLSSHVSEALLDSVAAQIGQQIALIAPALRDVELELGETYSVWGLKQAAYLVPLKDLKAHAFAAPSNSWHHQVKADEKAIAFARSVWTPGGKGVLTVSEVVVGHVARTVDAAFRWFWQAIPEEADARLLVVPSLYVHAFWLLDADHPAGRIVVADAPDELSALKRRELLSIEQFLDHVRSYMQPQGGKSQDKADPSLSEFGGLLPYFKGTGVKQLRATEVDLATSHGQEIQGVAKLRELFGTPDQPQTFNAVTVYFDDNNVDAPPQQSGTVTWYDARKGKSGRGPEWRLYYKTHGSLIQKYARPNDSLVFTVSSTNDVYLFIAKANSGIEQRLLWLFALVPMLGATLDAREVEKTAKRILAIAGIAT